MRKLLKDSIIIFRKQSFHWSQNWVHFLGLIFQTEIAHKFLDTQKNNACIMNWRRYSNGETKQRLKICLTISKTPYYYTRNTFSTQKKKIISMWSYIGTLFGYLYGLAISPFAYINQKLVNKMSAIKHQILLCWGYNILGRLLHLKDCFIKMSPSYMILLPLLPSPFSLNLKYSLNHLNLI